MISVTALSFPDWLARKRNLTDITEIGRGGMGTVYRVREHDPDRVLAVKVLLPELSGAGEQQRFRKEMDSLIRITHPAIIDLKFSDTTPNGYYFAMPYLDGGSLEDLIAKRRQSGRGFNLRDVVYYLKPIARALDYLHGELSPPLVHRDIKPANILLRAQPGSLDPSVLIDFGIAISPNESRLTRLGRVVGTEKYAAPELSHSGFQGEAASAASDNYALALIAFEMITLHHFKDTMPPQTWQTHRQVSNLAGFALGEDAAKHPEEVRAVLARGLSEIPAQRFRSASEFIDELGRCGKRKPPAARGATAVPTSSGRGKQWSGVRNALVAGAAVVPIAGISAGGWVMSHPKWNAAEESLVAALPQLLPGSPGQAGWADATCHSAEVAGGQRARIQCVSQSLGSFEVVGFQDQAARDGLVSSQLATFGSSGSEKGSDTAVDTAMVQSGSECTMTYYLPAGSPEAVLALGGGQKPSTAAADRNTIAIALIGSSMIDYAQDSSGWDIEIC